MTGAPNPYRRHGGGLLIRLTDPSKRQLDPARSTQNTWALILAWTAVIAVAGSLALLIAAAAVWP